METANRKLREAAKKLGVPLWAVATELGISEATMTRRLRRELPDSEREKYLEILNNLAREENANA